MYDNFNVRHHGACGDGAAKDTIAIQHAVDECSKAGGGVVYFPAGVYLSGTIYMKDNIQLLFDAGSVLKSSIDKEDFYYYELSPQDSQFRLDRCGLIYGRNVVNISIKGKGEIDGRDKEFWTPMETYGQSWNTSPPRYYANLWRPMTILFEGCSNVSIQDVTVKNSPVFTGWFIDCNLIHICNTNILNDFYGPNSDGFHFSSCHHVHVSGCHFETGDDAIAIDASHKQSSDNLTITNCTFNTSVNALRVYTGLDTGFPEEGKNEVRNVSFSNCTVLNASGIINITASNGTIENLTFSNIAATLKQEGTPFFLMTENGIIENVNFSNIVVNANGACTILGMNSQDISGITLENMRFKIGAKRKLFGLDVPDPIPNYGYHHFSPYNIYLRKVKGITLSNIRIDWLETEVADAWSAIKCTDVEDIEISSFTGKQSGAGSNVPSVLFENVSNAFIHGCRALKGTDIFLYLKGEKTNNICLMNNHLKESKVDVFTTDDVGKDVLVH